MATIIDNYNYVITSGWWCGKAKNEKRTRYGSETIREVDFFSQWKESIINNTNPRKVMVLDSASDTKPSLKQTQGIEFISLDHNAGHSTNHSGKFSGYMRSIIMGITYAKLCDSDYWVYVEQDVLLKGRGIIEHCISCMNTPYMFGSGDGTPQFLQQSLIIIRKDGYDDFLKHLNNIKSPDKLISPETKFLIASSLFYRVMPEKLFFLLSKKTITARLFRYLMKICLPIFKNYNDLPIGYGRARPINFDSAFYYFQHGSDRELNTHFKNNRDYNDIK